MRYFGASGGSAGQVRFTPIYNTGVIYSAGSYAVDNQEGGNITITITAQARRNKGTYRFKDWAGTAASKNIVLDLDGKTTRDGLTQVEMSEKR